MKSNANLQKRVLLAFAFLLASVGAGGLAWIYLGPPRNPITLAMIASAWDVQTIPKNPEQSWPTSLTIDRGGKEPETFDIEYTLDSSLHERMSKLLRDTRPDYASFVAMDAESGEIIAIESWARNSEFLTRAPQRPPLALRASFPAASVFKLVTSTAAIESKGYQADTVVAFNGANHTLYRRNVTKNDLTRWTRRMTIREAFARSVNTVFGKIGIFVLDAKTLQDFASRFRFNRPISTDLPVEQGVLDLDPLDDWDRAEVASGFTRRARMSPLQGALMAASVISDGKMPEAHVVRSLKSSVTGETALLARAEHPTPVMSAQTSGTLRILMRETVIRGTSSKAFRSFRRRKAFQDIEIGGKTGSLDGEDPAGRTDWFVGYAHFPAGSRYRKVALAALTVNEKKWQIKSSDIARIAIESLARSP